MTIHSIENTAIIYMKTMQKNCVLQFPTDFCHFDIKLILANILA